MYQRGLGLLLPLPPHPVLLRVPANPSAEVQGSFRGTNPGPVECFTVNIDVSTDLAYHTTQHCLSLCLRIIIPSTSAKPTTEVLIISVILIRRLWLSVRRSEVAPSSFTISGSRRHGRGRTITSE